MSSNRIERDSMGEPGIAKHAYWEGRTIIEVALGNTKLSREQLE